MDQKHINNQILAQLSALGARLDSIESSSKTVKKTNDSTKIKKSKVKTKANVTHTGSRGVMAVSPPVQTVHNISPPSRLREEARIHEEIQNRPRHLADNIKPGMGKIKSQGVGLWMYLLTKRSDGHMNLSSQVKIRTGLRITNCPQSN